TSGRASSPRRTWTASGCTETTTCTSRTPRSADARVSVVPCSLAGPPRRRPSSAASRRTAAPVPSTPQRSDHTLMIRYIARRVVFSLILLFVISLVVFFAMRLLPGDPVLARLGGTMFVDEAAIEKL